MAKKVGGLGGKGKGILSVIRTDTPTDEEVRAMKEDPNNRPEAVVPISKVEPNINQPRKNFGEDALIELSESIKLHGILNPLLVRSKGSYYEIVGGERRWRAAKMAGLTEVPVIIRNLDDRQVAEIALIDNLQRENLNPIEEALAYKRLIEEFDLKQDDVAKRVSKQRATITNTLRLLKLDPKVQEMLIEDMISPGHARQILALPEGYNQVEFAERIFDEKLSVRDTEKAVKLIQLGKSKKPGNKVSGQISAIYSDLEEQLKNHLGVKVRINAKTEDKGSIELEFYSKEQLQELINKLEA